jgi:hypothetical protein
MIDKGKLKENSLVLSSLHGIFESMAVIDFVDV